jgi:predicted nucleic acid-binding protein
MKSFVDTSPFIYLVESHETYGQQVWDLFLTSVGRNDQLVTSVITWMEFGVMPKKMGRLDLIEKFYDLLDRLGIPLVQINQAVADKAASLRAKYDFLKAMDALQLAVAIESDCDRFITNDKGLLRFQELQVLTLDQF